MAWSNSAYHRSSLEQILFGLEYVDNKSNIIVDFSTSILAEGKVRIHKIQKNFLRYFAIIDNKESFQKIKDFYNGGALLPFGGKKDLV